MLDGDWTEQRWTEYCVTYITNFRLIGTGQSEGVTVYPRNLTQCQARELCESNWRSARRWGRRRQTIAGLAQLGREEEVRKTRNAFETWSTGETFARPRRRQRRRALAKTQRQGSRKRAPASDRHMRTAEPCGCSSECGPDCRPGQRREILERRVGDDGAKRRGGPRDYRRASERTHRDYR